MAGFIQIIEYTTTRFEEAQALGEKFRVQRMSDDGPKPVRVTVAADRDRPGRFMSIVEFASYEEAMANSERADVGEFAQQMMALCDGPPTFHNLDIKESLGF